MSNPITKVDDKSYEETRTEKDDKKTRLRKHKGIRVGEGRWGLESRKQRGRIRVLQWEIFSFNSSMSFPVDSPCLPSRFTILLHKEVGRKNETTTAATTREKNEKHCIVGIVGTHLRLILFIATHGLQHYTLVCQI